jgi:iron(III) transport system ATP-binding protein
MASDPDNPNLIAAPSDPARPWPVRGRMGPVFAGNIAFEDVAYATSKQTIINASSFTLAAGKIACILGPSGCGKTTLLKLAAGVLRPTAGRILIDGMVVAGSGVFVPPEQRKVGLMFQDFALFPHMTALDNVAYGLYALPRREALSVAAAALESVGLPGKALRYPSQLSGGEQQRVALARAIVPRPRVILMDEPFSGLDQRLRETVRAETLSLLRKSQATALLVTHDPLEALAVADHIIVMRAGNIVQQGTPKAVLNRPVDAKVARFLGPYNEFVATVSAGQVATPLGVLPAHGFANGDKVLVFVAPGDVQLSTQKPHNGQILESRPMPDFRHYKVILTQSEQIVDVKTRLDQDMPVGAACSLVMTAGNPQIFHQD